MGIAHACFFFATNSPKLQLHYNLMKTCLSPLCENEAKVMRQEHHTLVL